MRLADLGPVRLKGSQWGKYVGACIHMCGKWCGGAGDTSRLALHMDNACSDWSGLIPQTCSVFSKAPLVPGQRARVWGAHCQGIWQLDQLGQGAVDPQQSRLRACVGCHV